MRKLKAQKYACKAIQHNEERSSGVQAEKREGFGFTGHGETKKTKKSA